MSMGEARPVIDYEQSHTATRDGKIVSLKSGKTLALWMTTKGYAQVCLRRRGTKKTAYVHRLVAEAFHGPARGRTVNHKDGVKTNNAAENLEWMTIKENNHHAILNGLKPASEKTIAMVSRQANAPIPPVKTGEG